VVPETILRRKAMVERARERFGFLLTATVQNLKRLIDRTARPPPQTTMA